VKISPVEFLLFRARESRRSLAFEIQIVFAETVWRLFKILSIWNVSNLRHLKMLSVSRVPQGPDEGVTFFAAEVAVRADNLGEDNPRSDDIYPQLGIKRIQKALVTSNRRCTAVIEGGKFYLPNAVDQGPWKIRPGTPNVAGILKQEQNSLLINVRTSRREIPRGVLAGTVAPHNWFHWTIDTLPSVYLSQFLPEEYDDVPLLLPETGLSRSSWREPLELVIGNRELIPLDSHSYSRVSDLIWIDSPTSPGPVQLEDSSLPKYRMHGSAMRAYRDHMIRETGLHEKPNPKTRRIYLARKQTGHRPYNQRHLADVAANYGFEEIYLEDLSYRESIKVFTEAQYVIGPHGAGWANCLYAGTHAKGLLWSWPQAIKDNWFANVAHVSGMQLRVIYTDPSNQALHDLQPAGLEAEIEGLLSNP
jgi:capsular polysaccharide biosynthesis protein